jgi:hypothetical protein
VNIVFDNCTAPVFATTLDGYFRGLKSGHRALHISEVPGLPKGRSTDDVDWLAHVRDAAETWIFVTGDRRLRANPAEVAALRSARRHGFLLAKGYQKTPLNEVCGLIVWRWPEIETLCGIVSPPTLHEVPISRSGKLRQVWR